MLETSALQIFHSGNSTFINLFDKTKFSRFIGQPQQYSAKWYLLYTHLNAWVWIVNMEKGNSAMI